MTSDTRSNASSGWDPRSTNSVSVKCGAKSPLWRGIQADVFGQDVQIMETQELSAIGAAIIAGVGIGLFSDFESACEKAIVLGETVRCDADRIRQYEECYQRYCELYPILKDWFRS